MSTVEAVKAMTTITTPATTLSRKVEDQKGKEVAMKEDKKEDMVVVAKEEDMEADHRRVATVEVVMVASNNKVVTGVETVATVSREDMDERRDDTRADMREDRRNKVEGMVDKKVATADNKAEVMAKVVGMVHSRVAAMVDKRTDSKAVTKVVKRAVKRRDVTVKEVVVVLATEMVRVKVKVMVEVEAEATHRATRPLEVLHNKLATTDLKSRICSRQPCPSWAATSPRFRTKTWMRTE